MQNLAPDTSAPRLQHIVIYGGGIAAQMTAAALAHQAPDTLRITWLKSTRSAASDAFYGSVTTPLAYDFNLSVGVTEPDVILDSNTAFSYGTHYADWGVNKASWVQTFHQPFPILEGVPFQHYLSQQDLFAIEPYLTSAVAARRGVFAHPPEDQAHPLARAEYGYQLEASAYGALFESAAATRIAPIVADIVDVKREGDLITAVVTGDGQKLTADLYVDCSGPDAALLSSLEGTFDGTRPLAALASFRPTAELGAPVRALTAGDFGWSSLTPLQGGIARLTVFDPNSEAQASEVHGDQTASRTEVTLGSFQAAWRGNCVAIGQAAGVLEPVSSAPLMLLQRDIERLLSLLPISQQMSVERKEFNRQYREDYRHASLFNRALFVGAFPDTPYWRAAQNEPLDERLITKIEQFESRGLHVAFDLEPFNQEDWLILHYGMGRRPARYDRVAERASRDRVSQYLATMRHNIDRSVDTMPRHNVYMKGLTSYLKQQNARVP